ncbi:hypothetical protein BJV74DRAFT_839157 [Russula compacta]|nr:hypothetical protein BJV74DRAFT_839157 [Russula compacta]
MSKSLSRDISICHLCDAVGRSLRCPLVIKNLAGRSSLSLSFPSLFSAFLPPQLSCLEQIMSIRRTASTGQQKSREHSAGGFSGVPKVPPQTTGVCTSTKWRKLSSGARSILCICAASRVYQASESGGVLHARSMSDVSWSSPPHDVAPLYRTPDRVQQMSTTKVGGSQGRQAARDKGTRPRPPERTSAANVNAQLIKERDAHRQGEASSRLRDHLVVLPHLNSTRPEGAKHQAATGNTVVEGRGRERRTDTALRRYREGGFREARGQDQDQD